MTRESVAAREPRGAQFEASESRQAFLLELSDALRPLVDAAECERVATRMLGTMLGADRVFYAIIDADETAGFIRSEYLNGIPSGAGHHSISAFERGLVREWKQGRSTTTSDVNFDPRFPEAARAALARVSTRAVLAVPLLKDGRLVALLGVNQATTREWTDAEIRLTEEAAERTRASVERANAEVSLRESDARQAFLLNLTDGLRAIEDPVTLQAEAARILGQHLGATRALYAEIAPDGEGIVIEQDYVNGVPSLAGRLRLSDFGAAIRRSIHAGQTVVVADSIEDGNLTDKERLAYAAVSVAAHIDVPLLKDGRLVAVLAVHQDTARAWTEHAVVLVEETAQRTWAAVERAKAERSLRDSEAKYRLVFDSIDEGLCVVQMIFDADGRPVDYRFLETNRLFESQTGLTNAVGRTARELVPELESHWFEIYGRVALTGEPERFQNGSATMGRWFDVFAFRIGQAADRRVGILFKNVTAAHVAERTREQLLVSEKRARADADSAREEADLANQAKSDFLAVMSHELRTPLNAIGGHVQLLEMGIHGPVTEAQREALGRVRRSERHLLAVINDVLNFAKLEAGRVEYDMEDVHLAGALAAAEAMIEPQLAAKRIAFDVRVPNDMLVLADEDKLQQIMLNLLSNAVKFTRPGGRITVDTSRREAMHVHETGALSVRVSDTGIGIARDKLESIFDPFVQVHRRVNEPSEGTGLGLAISRDLARGMGGDLRVRSVEGEGSTFTLTLSPATRPP